MSVILSMQNSLLEMEKSSTQNSAKYRRWFNLNADMFKEVDFIQSKIMAKQIDAEIKRCYANCVRAVIRNRKLRYYEGYTTTIGIPIEHAFLVDENDQVIDPTLAIDSKIATKQSKTLYGVECNIETKRIGSEYYGIEIPRSDLMKVITKKEANYLGLAFLYWEMKFK